MPEILSFERLFYEFQIQSQRNWRNTETKRNGFFEGKLKTGKLFHSQKVSASRKKKENQGFPDLIEAKFVAVRLKINGKSVVRCMRNTAIEEMKEWFPDLCPEAIEAVREKELWFHLRRIGKIRT